MCWNNVVTFPMTSLKLQFSIGMKYLNTRLKPSKSIWCQWLKWKSISCSFILENLSSFNWHLLKTEERHHSFLFFSYRIYLIAVFASFFDIYPSIKCLSNGTFTSSDFIKSSLLHFEKKIQEFFLISIKFAYRIVLGLFRKTKHSMMEVILSSLPVNLD